MPPRPMSLVLQIERDREILGEIWATATAARGLLTMPALPAQVPPFGAFGFGLGSGMTAEQVRPKCIRVGGGAVGGRWEADPLESRRMY